MIRISEQDQRRLYDAAVVYFMRRARIAKRNGQLRTMADAVREAWQAHARRMALQRQ